MRKEHFEIAGWVLFILCAICYCIASIGSFWSMAGSVLFLVACFVFLIPYFQKDEQAG